MDTPFYNQNGIEVRRSLKTDTFELKQDDCNEVYWSHGLMPDEAIEMSLDSSLVSFTVWIDGKPEIIFGINPVSILGNSAIIYMLSSERIKDIGLRFARHSREYVDYFLSYYSHLFNYISVENHSSITWLKMLGAKFYEVENYGIYNKPFVKFEFKR